MLNFCCSAQCFCTVAVSTLSRTREWGDVHKLPWPSPNAAEFHVSTAHSEGAGELLQWAQRDLEKHFQSCVSLSTGVTNLNLDLLWGEGLCHCPCNTAWVHWGACVWVRGHLEIILVLWQAPGDGAPDCTAQFLGARTMKPVISALLNASFFSAHHLQDFFRSSLYLWELNAPSLKHCVNPREQLLMFFFMDLQPKVKEKKNLIREKSEQTLI